jgi:hypothetical protein
MPLKSTELVMHSKCQLYNFFDYTKHAKFGFIYTKTYVIKGQAMLVIYFTISLSLCHLPYIMSLRKLYFFFKFNDQVDMILFPNKIALLLGILTFNACYISKKILSWTVRKLHILNLNPPPTEVH